VSAALSAWTSALLLLDEETYDIVRFWVAGSVINRDMGVFFTVLPFLLCGSLASILLGHQLNVLSMGDETASSLGMRTGRTRLICTLLVVVIAGAAVSIAGPIGFVGLAAPHMVRTFVGADYRWVMKDSQIVATGTPSDVLTSELLRMVFEVEAAIHVDPRTGTPLVMPLALSQDDDSGPPFVIVPATSEPLTPAASPI
jgi:iron complex transport system permease protein